MTMVWLRYAISDVFLYWNYYWSRSRTIQTMNEYNQTSEFRILISKNLNLHITFYTLPMSPRMILFLQLQTALEGLQIIILLVLLSFSNPLP